MRAAKILVVGLMVAGCTSAGGGGDSSITGQVKVSGQPAPAGTTLLLAGPTGQTATTDASGKYTFTKLHDGTYAVIAELASTAEQRVVVNVSVGKSASAAAPDIAFTGVGNIKGVATLPGAQSSAGIAVGVDGSSAVALTDTAGNYLLKGVAVGHRKVSAVVPGTGSATTEVDVAFGKDVTAAPMVVGKGTGSISGVVHVSSGDPTGVVVELVGPTSGAATPASDGSYSFPGLPAGSYVVTAHGGNLAPPSQSLQVTLGAGEAKTAVSFDFVATGNVSGTVSFTDGGAVANATVVAAGSSASAYTSAAGAYTLDGIPAGDQSLTVFAGNIQPLTQVVTVQAGKTTTHDFKVVPSHGPATLQSAATLPGGAPASGASVVLASGESTRADDGGSYAFANLASGVESVSISGLDPAYVESIPNVFAASGNNGYYFGNGRVEALAPVELERGIRAFSASCVSLVQASPDGAEAVVAFSSNPFCARALLRGPSSRSGMMRVKADGTAVELPLPDPSSTVQNIQYSPTGATLMISSYTPTQGAVAAHYDTVLVWVNGAHPPLTLTSSSGGQDTAQFSPDGAAVLIVQLLATSATDQRQLSVVDTRAANPAPVVLDAQAGAPLGNTIVQEAGDRVFWEHIDLSGASVKVAALDGSGARTLATLATPMTTSDYLLADPAGRFVLIDQAGALGAVASDDPSVNPTPAPVATHVTGVSAFVNNAYLVSTMDPQTASPSLVRANISLTGSASVVTTTLITGAPQSSLNFVLSTDASLVVARTFGDGGSQLAVSTAVSGAAPTKLSSGTSVDFGFIGTTNTVFDVEGVAINLWTVAADGTVAPTKTVTTGQSTPGIQVRGPLSFIYVDGTGATVLADDQLQAPTTLPAGSSGFNFSPDGKHLAFVVNGAAAVVTPPAAPTTTTLAATGAVLWSADNAHLLIQEAVAQQWTLTDVGNTSPHHFTNITCVDGFSPDGKVALMRTPETTGNTSTLELVNVARGTLVPVIGHNPDYCDGALAQWLSGDHLLTWRGTDPLSPYAFQAGAYVVPAP